MTHHAVRSRTFAALGSRCELHATGAAAEHLSEAEAWVHAMHARLTRFDSASELSHLNASAGSGWVAVSAVLAALLRASLDAFSVSRGLVHAGVLPALRAAGYTRTFEAGTAGAQRDGMRPVRPLPELLAVRGTRARLRPGAAIDLGGIAKGWLADRVASSLGDAVVNLGGDIAARGGGPGGEGWAVGIGDTTVLLHDAAVATSGTTGRRWGDGLHHLIDPRTGRPAATDLSEVSAIAKTATDAEVLAKTALLLGSAAAVPYLEQRSGGWSLA